MNFKINFKKNWFLSIFLVDDEYFQNYDQESLHQIFEIKKSILESNYSLANYIKKMKENLILFDITENESLDNFNFYLKVYDDFAGKKIKVLFRIYQTQNKEVNDLIFQVFVRERVLKCYTSEIKEKLFEYLKSQVQLVFSHYF